MKAKYFLCILTLMIIAADTTSSLASAKKQKTYCKIVEAYTQRTIPGIPGKEPKVSEQIVIVWLDAKYPETFFWYGESGWLTCDIKLATKQFGKGVNGNYTTSSVANDDIHKGDTLLLTPMRGGKFAIPKEATKSAKNTLFFKAGGSGWLSMPVKNMGKKPDILLR